MSFRPFAKALVAAGLVSAAVPAFGAMTTGQFVTRARALQAQGVTALLTPEFQTLRGEAQGATAQLKAERDARKAAGKPPIACVPEGQSIGITDMLDGLDALPAADKKLPLKDGYAQVLARRFPCR
jgi:hypothetical protein